MKTTESEAEVEIETSFFRAVRLTFMASLAFWPLFLFAAKYMVEVSQKTTTALMEWHILVDGTWVYPLAVIIAWRLYKRGLRVGRSDVVCLLPWLLPALMICYWPVYFVL